jgi:hypothetical protein
MRKLILTILAAALMLAVPSTSRAAIVEANGGAGARNHKLLWSLSYDTSTKDVTLDVTHTQFDGSPAIGDPQQADIVVIRPNGQEQDFNLLTLRNPVDGQPGVINDGPLVFSIPGGLRVSPDRAAILEFRTEYTPPLGA